VEVAEAGRLDGARRQRSGRWPVAAPVRADSNEAQKGFTRNWSEATLTDEGGAAVLRHDSGVEKWPPWLTTASEVTRG
jgi:hypothetical protein